MSSWRSCFCTHRQPPIHFGYTFNHSSINIRQNPNLKMNIKIHLGIKTHLAITCSSKLFYMKIIYWHEEERDWKKRVKLHSYFISNSNLRMAFISVPCQTSVNRFLWWKQTTVYFLANASTRCLTPTCWDVQAYPEVDTDNLSLLRIQSTAAMERPPWILEFLPLQICQVHWSHHKRETVLLLESRLLSSWYQLEEKVQYNLVWIWPVRCYYDVSVNIIWIVIK